MKSFEFLILLQRWDDTLGCLAQSFVNKCDVKQIKGQKEVTVFHYKDIDLRKKSILII